MNGSWHGSRRPARPWALPVALGLALFSLGIASVLLTPPGSRLAAWWPGAGLSVAAVATTSGRRRAVMLLTAVAATGLSTVGTGREPSVALVFTIVNAVETALVGSWLGRAGPPRLRSMRDLGELLVATGCGAAVAGGIAAIGLLLAGIPTTSLIWSYVAASHAAAVLVIVPLVMRLPGRAAPVGWPERAALWVAAVGTAGVVFGLGDDLPLTFLPVAVLAWTSSRLGARASAVQLVVVGITAAALTRLGLGPFAAVGRDRPSGAGALVQLFVIASAVLVLVLAVSAAQRMAAIAELADQRRFDQAVLEVVNAGVVACDAEGTIVVRNAAHRRLAGDQWAQAADLRYEDGTLVPPGQSPLRRALAGEDATDVVLRVGSRPFEVITVARQIRSEDGRPMGAVAAFDRRHRRAGGAGPAAGERGVPGRGVRGEPRPDLHEGRRPGRPHLDVEGPLRRVRAPVEGRGGRPDH